MDEINIDKELTRQFNCERDFILARERLQKIVNSIPGWEKWHGMCQVNFLYRRFYELGKLDSISKALEIMNGKNNNNSKL